MCPAISGPLGQGAGQHAMAGKVSPVAPGSRRVLCDGGACRRPPTRGVRHAVPECTASGAPPHQVLRAEIVVVGPDQVAGRQRLAFLMWHASLPSLVSRSWTSCRGDGHTARVTGQGEGAEREMQREGLKGWPRSGGTARDLASGVELTEGGIPPDSRRPGEHSPI